MQSIGPRVQETGSWIHSVPSVEVPNDRRSQVADGHLDPSQMASEVF